MLTRLQIVYPLSNMHSKTLHNPNSAFYHPAKDIEPNVNTAADRVPFVEHAFENSA
jgi:hypothetical protein